MLTITPKSIDELKVVLTQIDSKSKFIGGGTDLIIRLVNNPDMVSSLVYLGYIPEYKEITFGNNIVRIGAMATMTEIHTNKDIMNFFPALSDAASDMGSLQVRNKGTIGGNIANSSPAGDLLPVLALYDARVEILGPEGIRIVNFNDFIISPGKNILRFNEAIIAVYINKNEGYSSFVKLGSRKKVTIARIGCALNIIMDNDYVKEMKLYMGAIGIKPVKLIEAEEFIKGKVLNQYNIEEIAKFLSAYIKQNVPEEFDRDYKVYAAKSVILDAFDKLAIR